jgi:Dyp-type peroxidase family
MRCPIPHKDSNLASGSDLIVLAPLRSGFVPALDAVTYRTRVERVLRTLHVGRGTGHEFDWVRLLSDAVERVGRIHSVRISVLEPKGDGPHVMLAASFDGDWESYVRVIWQKVARLLDLVFCNTEDYVVGWTSSFDEWKAWLRGRQATSAFLYAMPGLTVDDAHYLRMHERLSRHLPTSDVELNRISVASAEATGYSWFHQGTSPAMVGLGQPLHVALEAQPALFRQGLRSLVGLYRLADVYPPNTPEGAILHAAARELLPDFVRLMPDGEAPSQAGWERAQARFEQALAWFTDTSRSRVARPSPPPLPAEPETGPLAHIQAGLIDGYEGVDSGVLALLAFDSSEALASFLDSVTPTNAQAQPLLLDGDISCNLALTVEGLRLAGLSARELEQLPVEFTQGMERRAGLLGDVRGNHPRRWSLPTSNWAQGVAASDEPEQSEQVRVQLSTVHLLLQLRLISRLKNKLVGIPDAQARELLFQRLQTLTHGPGVQRLSLQWMTRQREAGSGETLEHFGFRDGASDPVLRATQAGKWFKNQVHAGELLMGGANASEPAPPVPGNGAEDWLQRLLYRGSFLVVRKLRQDVPLLDALIAAAATQDAQAAQAAQDPNGGLSQGQLLAKLMGRSRDGKPLAAAMPAAKNDNDFLFESDPSGALCPLHAHIRRANPRQVVRKELRGQLSDAARVPRIFRRGMSYGPPYLRDADETTRAASAALERGMVFMAYNASISEQFETVQSWLAGGNSTGGYSGHADPFMGLSEPGLPRVLRFEAQGRTVRVQLSGDTDPLTPPKPLVRLEWGGYFFTPTLPALKQLAQRAHATGLASTLPWSATKGELLIQHLFDIEQQHGAAAARDAWKEQLEDSTAALEVRTAHVWAAIRELHCGVLRTPYGVLVAAPELVKEQVLENASGALTSSAYLPRMRRSFGEIYLGMDTEDPRYAVESAACNAAIMARDWAQTRSSAHEVVRQRLGGLVQTARDHAQEDEALRRSAGLSPKALLPWDITIELRELIEELLAHFCEAWFGLSESSGFLKRGGLSWIWQAGEPVPYPGHFMAPSRYIFQAHPQPTVERVGAEHGQGMLAAVQAHLQAVGPSLTAPIARAVLDAPPTVHDPQLAARNLVGAMMGMVPTVDANLRRVMNLWLEDGVLWSLRATQAQAELIDKAFVHSMLERAAPDMLWRTAVRGFTLGTGAHAVDVRPGELVVAGLTSATNRHREVGLNDVSPAFGGNRPQAQKPGHACPGYRPAMAMMLGFAEALVATPWRMRAGPAPLTIQIDGSDAFAENPSAA